MQNLFKQICYSKFSLSCTPPRNPEVSFKISFGAVKEGDKNKKSFQSPKGIHCELIQLQWDLFLAHNDGGGGRDIEEVEMKRREGKGLAERTKKGLGTAPLCASLPDGAWRFPRWEHYEFMSSNCKSRDTHKSAQRKRGSTMNRDLGWNKEHSVSRKQWHNAETPAEWSIRLLFLNWASL